MAQTRKATSPYPYILLHPQMKSKVGSLVPHPLCKLVTKFQNWWGKPQCMKSNLKLKKKKEKKRLESAIHITLAELKKARVESEIQKSNIQKKVQI
jgi:hypothetical protein